ncbi:MAG: PQQ-dependent sugar dehydrogenase [Candidatus Thiodiazotropha sp. (ex Ctena orbiculata)]|uniref:PQQ-dependent sugar dehydrogenase n=1 Tax=Candidatus Thiodiazotropha taylori TaxID=2792791 RepID=A0A944M8L1_9GAMM|nr:PQQ-dependent sugar dehydrogenase [Candidatus Thiodiazotropha taylori]MBT2989218.1 PQQ-dependent sugar dehydrogenase [Candidatus Thiodiazotropha taylori]MBT2995571.1 PQQ-dependent sugar dehydrogenase [Candidatus Thiodiazotropha taylori]MBT2999475.1 PQQ-dependent sugar dehydrogenase [Candidatus Thiodiazotropha taylori]MBT3025707.1 PQQ-dependent sugar dehydrogenase [Candidatus Thiodiazotropha taylori]
MPVHNERFALVVLISVLGWIGGCGGGGGGDSAPATGLQVDAGTARTLSLPDTLTPNPSVLVDGMPPSNQVSYAWSQLGGPATVGFSDPSAASPEIGFPANGSYRLMLEVSDQGLSESDLLRVTVNTRAAGPSGLTALPINQDQCVAPADAGTATGIQLSTPYPSLPSLGPLVGLFQVPGDNSLWYALRQTGQVIRFDNDPGVSNTQTFIDISDRVDYGGEKGLLGMAFHPDYADNGFVYLSYTASPAGGLESRISRFTLDSATQTLDPGSEQILLTVSQPYSNHNGGHIAFGPDGLLYIGLGDGGSGGDPLGHGQNTATLLGSLLRIDVGDGLGGYTIPADNPFVSGGGAAEIYAYGLRNPWRWSFDRQVGDLWLGDVGQNAYEEVDIISRGGNYGWNLMEGNQCYPASANCDSTGLTLPVAEYDHSQGISITGGYVYRGSALNQLAGRYLFSDYGSGVIWGLVDDGSGGYRAEELLDSDLNIVSFAEDQSGELYVLHLGGSIHKLTAVTSGSGAVPTLLSAWGCFQPGDVERFSDNVIPYNINALLWSDFADKERFMALPDGGTISIDAEGRFVFPPGSVLGKHFRLDGELIETRLLMRHANSGWRGYSYEWNDTLTDAVLLDSAKDKAFANQTWHYPSSAECLLCHTGIAGVALGPELGQLNRDFPYPAQSANQLITYEAIGLLADPLSDTQKSTVFYAIDDTAYAAERRARSYLHSNCAMCHQPGGTGGGDLDMRMSASLAATGLCNQAPLTGDLGLNNPVLLKPGDPDNSILVLRMETMGETRMPPLGSGEVDTQAVAVIREWISGLLSCDAED